MKAKKIFTNFVLVMALILCCAMPAFDTEVPYNGLVEPASMNAIILQVGDYQTFLF